MGEMLWWLVCVGLRCCWWEVCEGVRCYWWEVCVAEILLVGGV